MDPTIPWSSHRYSPIMPRKVKLIPNVSQRLDEMIPSTHGCDEGMALCGAVRGPSARSDY
jgi:hypothetical protein